jgi:DNA invertase Pin-like site-specific DNA recombinase
MILTMLAAVAEMERDLLVERTQSGLEREGGGQDARAPGQNQR